MENVLKAMVERMSRKNRKGYDVGRLIGIATEFRIVCEKVLNEE
jgi:hypothetical protein